MLYLNEVRLIGRAVADAEFKQVGGDSRVASFRLVSNRRIKQKNGEYEEKSTFVDVEVWNQRADYAKDKVTKGAVCMVRGQLETDEWESKEGQKRSKLKIYAHELQVDYAGGERESGAKSQKEAVAAQDTSDLPF